jgi:hypothetical protein
LLGGHRPKNRPRARQDKGKSENENMLFFFTFAFYLSTFAFTIAALQRCAGVKLSKLCPAPDFPQCAIPDNVSTAVNNSNNRLLASV